MEDLFFHPWNQPRPRYSPTYGGYPASQQCRPAAVKPNPSSKVVSIPIHYVGSETEKPVKVQKPDPKKSEQPKRSAPEAAVKIQKVFRGFLVRKIMERIASIRSEVDQIERRVLRVEFAELIRRDNKERLRINESLMALLFKLDSVPGVDFGVRVCRKAVIKKTIALQEKVDAIATADAENADVLTLAGTVDNANADAASADQILHATEEAMEEELVDSNADAAFVDQTLSITDEVIDSIVEEVDAAPADQTLGDRKVVDEAMEDEAEVVDSKTADASAVNQAVDSKDSESEEWLIDMDEADGRVPVPGEEDYDVIEVERATEREDKGVSEKLGDGVQLQRPELVEGGVKEDLGVGERDDNKGNRELLKKIMEDNERMKNLLVQLSERNQVQTLLLTSLSQRVDQLEKDSLSQKLRKKKKKRHIAA